MESRMATEQEEKELLAKLVEKFDLGSPESRLEILEMQLKTQAELIDRIQEAWGQKIMNLEQLATVTTSRVLEHGQLIGALDAAANEHAASFDLCVDAIKALTAKGS